MSDRSAKLQVVKDIRPVVSAFTAAAGFMRGIAIKLIFRTVGISGFWLCRIKSK